MERKRRSSGDEVNTTKRSAGEHHMFRSFWFVLVKDPQLIKLDSNTRRAKRELLVKRQITLNKSDKDAESFQQLLHQTFPELSNKHVFSLWQLRGNNHALVPVPLEVDNAMALCRCQELKRSCVYIRTVERPLISDAGTDNSISDHTSDNLETLADLSANELQPTSNANVTTVSFPASVHFTYQLPVNSFANSSVDVQSHGVTNNLSSAASFNDQNLSLVAAQFQDVRHDLPAATTSYTDLLYAAAYNDQNQNGEASVVSSTSNGIPPLYDVLCRQPQITVVDRSSNNVGSHDTNQSLSGTEDGELRQPDRAAVDISKCFLCKQLLIDPRTLPCFHSFCLSCLENNSLTATTTTTTIDSSPATGTCPHCRGVFSIPHGGYKNLPVNHFIDKLAQLKKIANQDGNKSCEVCHFTAVNGLSVADAVGYCVTCRQKLCADCCQKHTVINATRSHIIQPLGETNAAGLSEQLKQLKLVCSIHIDRPADLHCSDCSQPVCTDCLWQHTATGHNLESLTDAVERCRSDLSHCLDKLNTTLNQLEQRQQKSNRLKDDYDLAKRAIFERVDVLKTKIDELCNRLLTELDNFYGKCCVGDVSSSTAAGTYMSVSTIKALTEELLSMGSMSDLLEQKTNIVMAVRDLSERNDVFQTKCRDAVVKFDVEDDDDFYEDTDNGIKFGKLELCPVAHVIETTHGKCIAGLTVHDNELFIVRDMYGGFIEVYNATNFAFKRNIAVEEPDGEKVRVNGLTSCDTNHCLYISRRCYRDYRVVRSDIVRVDLIGNNEVVPLSLKKDYEPQGLSINSRRNLLVSCHVPPGNCFLLEYTTRGELIRETLLEESVDRLQHAMELNSNEVVVCGYVSGIDEDDKCYRGACIVDAYGRVQHRLRRRDKRHIADVRSLAVDRNRELIFVAEEDYGIVVFDSVSREWLFVITASASPLSLYFDDLRNLLFVGLENGEVFICSV